MKKNVLLSTAALAIISFAACSPEKKENNETGEAQEVAISTASDTEFTIDLEASKIAWIGTKIGGAHHGIIKLQSAELGGNMQTETFGHGKFIIDMNSIVCEDLTEAEGNQKLVGHLKSADFFDVEKYPTATFEIVSAERIAGSDRFAVTGNLTIKETTNSISFEALVSEDAGTYTAESDTIRIDRTQWGVNYGSKNIFKNLKDNIIDDQITLVVTLVGRI